MKQLIQNLNSGETLLEDVPVPLVKAGCVLIQSTKSLVSLGTERMLLKFSRSSLLEKARQEPARVKQVFDKIKTDGLSTTFHAVFNKLNQPIPMGYCHVGKVIAVGAGVTDLQIGDRVASNGAHAEVVCIPRNLVAKIPDNVSDKEATFTVVGAIGLQGIRLLNPMLGETIVVIGLGLIGLLTAALLKINGCRVIGIDIDEKKLDIARENGIIVINPLQNSSEKVVLEITNGVGADGVIIAASNNTNDIIEDAAKMTRKRGRVILIGVVPLSLPRSEFYEKELTFQVSCSYGPGRYDADYEQKGMDYPIAFVRWTENRNFQTILSLLESKSLDLEKYVSRVVDFHNYKEVYDHLIAADSIATIFSYTASPNLKSEIAIATKSFEGRKGVVGIIGAGNFTKMTLLPAIKSANIKYIASANGLTGTLLAKKYQIAYSTTDYQQILDDKDVDLVLITTRHHVHGKLVLGALRTGKHVFVEKPLTIFEEELDEIQSYYQENQATTGSLIVGFNRRFSPFVQKMKSLLGNTVMNVVATMNAGSIDASSWVHDPSIGGGRILGEACHYIDLITYLTGSKIVSVCMNAMGTQVNEATDNASILLRYENGSTGVVNYFSNGSKSYPKERIEVYAEEKTLILDNFRSLHGFGFKNFSKMKSSMDKGHQEQFQRLLDSVTEGGEPIIPYSEIINVTKATFGAITSMKNKAWVDI